MPSSPPRILNEQIVHVDPSTLTPHPRNPRRGDMEAIKASILANGFYGTIVAQVSTRYVLAGNHRLIAAQSLGLTQVPVCWVDVDDTRALAILAADNRTADLGTYDESALAEVLADLQLHDALDGTGYDDADLQDLIHHLDSCDPTSEDGTEDVPKYTSKMVLPIYEPRGLKPDVASLVDRSKSAQLIQRIEAEKDLPDDVRDFLKAAAYRHDVFNFAYIAEFYAHSEAHVQRLFEESALVIIDFDSAIEHGFVKMTERLLAISGQEQGVSAYDEE